MKKIDFASILRRQDNYFIAYIIFIVLLTAYYLFQFPIFVGDTDLWYHLNSGRYIIENGSIPKDSFFSFIEPPREWVDYFWLFQVLVYKIYSFSQYYGLVLLRFFVFLAVISIIINFFLKGYEGNKPLLYITVVFSLHVLLFLPRYHLIRPHMFTYLFIVIFLYVLEIKPKMVILLPILAVIWSNVHGITYPVMLLIILSYLVEFFYNRIKTKTHITKGKLPFLIPLILCIMAVYCTPHGSKLTSIPFVPTGFASLYIEELQRLSIEDLFSFHIVKWSPTHLTVFNLLFIIAVLSFVTVIYRRMARLSHVLMFLGGAVLLTKGNRFMFEFIILSIPIVRNALIAVSSSFTKKAVLKPVSFLLICMVLLLPVLCIKDMFKNVSRFPVSFGNLPHGIASFLNKVDGKGTVLNHPNDGGYLQWMLYPRYKIFMDMEAPFLFSNEDVFIANSAFKNRLFLQKLIDQYDPSFITVSIKNTFFRDVMTSFPKYKIIFFDDCEVLYANQNKNPSVVAAYELKTFDPFSLAHTSIGSIKTLNGYESMLKELLKIAEIYPDNGIANQCLAIFHAREGKYDKAIRYVDNIIRNYPESATGYTLKGDILLDMGIFDSAIRNYKMALKRWDVAEIHRKIGMVFYKQHRFGEAYHTLVRAMDVYSVETTYKDLYYLIVSAIESGKIREAEILFRYAYQSVPPGDKEWYEKYQELQTKIQEPGARNELPRVKPLGIEGSIEARPLI
jgi:tetratricopeptide (TPR) repeat protein